MAFNPDAYLQKNAPAQVNGGFDPDAYLAKSAPDAPKTSPGMTALESYGNAATLGYLPHIQAAVEPGFTAAMNALTGKNVQVDQSYTERRDENIKRQALQKQENPRSAMAGTVAGIGASALLTSGLIPAAARGTTLAKGVAGPLNQATKMQAINQAAKVGGAMGALANPGDTEGEISPLQIEDRGKNAAIGAALGAGTQGVISGISAAAPATSKWLSESAAGRAWKALGGNKRANEKAGETGQDLIIGRQMLDEGAVPIIGTPGRIARRVDKLKEEAGSEIGEILDTIDAKRGSIQPSGFEASGKPRTLVGEVKYTPVETRIIKDGSPVELAPRVSVSPVETGFKPGKESVLIPERTVQKASARSVQRSVDSSGNPIQSVSLEFQDALEPAVSAQSIKPFVKRDGPTKTLTEAVRVQGVKPVVKKAGPVSTSKESVQMTPIKPTFPKEHAELSVDMPAVANAVRSTDAYRSLSKQFGADRAKEALDKYLTEVVAAEGNSGARAAQDLRRNVDKGINFTKRNDDLSPSQEVLYELRTKIRDAMNEVANKLPGQQKDALLRANKRYSGLETASDLVGKKIAANNANQTFGLGDKLATTAGAATGNGLVGIAAGAVNKAARSFGNSAMARALDASAKGASVAGAAAGKSNPAIIGAITGGASGNDFTESDLSEPQLLEEFRNNPQLLENVSDPKIRAIIKRNLGRSPTAIDRRLKSAK